jgi:glycosyltransferase involved in cell wall biosynthesis
VPPRLYGGTERVVSFLTEELVARGHEVTLFASGDSVTSARLVPGCDHALRLGSGFGHIIAWETLQLEQVFSRAAEFDILHFHLDPPQLPLARRCGTASLTTLHGRLDLPGLAEVFGEFREHALVSISDAQRIPLPPRNWAGTVYHGLPPERFTMGDGSGGYLAFLGRTSPEKGVDRAIRVARAAGVPLRLAAKLDDVDREFFDTTLAPLLEGPGVEFVGEIGDEAKSEFLGRAIGVLFPIDWPEPFGLVMIEAIACGTPVIAWRRGSVPEVIEDGVTGFIVEDEPGAVRAVGRLGALERAACRREFERRFTAGRMAADYVGVYERLVARHGNRP